MLAVSLVLVGMSVATAMTLTAFRDNLMFYDDTGVFVAHTVLAKHDDNYMPPEVADSLATQGYKPEHTP